jgi:hypothetical protein
MTEILLTYLRPQQCPHCGTPIESAGEDQVHCAGDVFVCSQCTEFIVFDDNFILRTATKEDFNALNHQARNHLNHLRLKVIVDQAKARLKTVDVK